MQDSAVAEEIACTHGHLDGTRPRGDAGRHRSGFPCCRPGRRRRHRRLAAQPREHRPRRDLRRRRGPHTPAQAAHRRGRARRRPLLATAVHPGRPPAPRPPVGGIWPSWGSAQLACGICDDGMCGMAVIVRSRAFLLCLRSLSVGCCACDSRGGVFARSALPGGNVIDFRSVSFRVGGPAFPLHVT